MLKGRVLLLNATFEVLGTIGVARAIRMTLRDSNPVKVLEYADRVLTSAGGDKFQVPSVISLSHFVNVRKKRQESGAKRLKIYIRDKYKCGYCSVGVGKKHPVLGRKLEVKDLTLDHITPKSQGGSGLPENLVTACKPCNQKKADRNPEVARMPLRTEIHDIADIGIDKVLLCRYVEHNPKWLPYLEGQEGFEEALQLVAAA